MVPAMTARPRIRRNGLTPRTNSSSPHTKRATSASTRSTCSVPPFGSKTCKATVRTMNTHNGTFGHWATVMRPVRRFSSVQRAARRTTPCSGSGDSAEVTDQPCPIPPHHGFRFSSRCPRPLARRCGGLRHPHRTVAEVTLTFATACQLTNAVPIRLPHNAG